MEKVLDILKKYRDVIYIIIISCFIALCIKQCNSNHNLDNELIRQHNNITAMTDTIKNYRDKLGMSVAERQAYQLTQDELRDSIGLLKQKNIEYSAYINSIIGIRDTISIETIIERKNEDCNIENGNIIFNKKESFGKSSRDLSVNIPYSVDSVLHTGVANVNLSQDIFVESWLERNTKNNQTYVKLRSDYPNVVFNSGMGIDVINSPAYEKSLRKNQGIGLAIGPSVGLSYDMINKKMVPTIGVSLTIGYTYTPKWTQW